VKAEVRRQAGTHKRPPQGVLVDTLGVFLGRGRPKLRVEQPRPLSGGGGEDLLDPSERDDLGATSDLPPLDRVRKDGHQPPRQVHGSLAPGRGRLVPTVLADLAIDE
jgi:hypothetical protein